MRTLYMTEDWRYEHWRRHMIAGLNYEHGQRIKCDYDALNAAMDFRINAMLASDFKFPREV